MTFNYKTATSTESIGPYGTIGIKIDIAIDRPLTQEEQNTLNTHLDQIKNEILYHNIKLHPTTQQNKNHQKQQLTQLFTPPTTTQEIPNQYHGPQDPYGKNYPWYQITTNYGTITIGWRKRVISIDWTNTNIQQTAEQLFPNIHNTKHNKTIHAYSYQEAHTIIKQLEQQAQNT